MLTDNSITDHYIFYRHIVASLVIVVIVSCFFFLLHKYNKIQYAAVTQTIKEIKNAPSALMSYISTREFLRIREKCGEARAEGECFSHFSSV